VHLSRVDSGGSAIELVGSEGKRVGEHKEVKRNLLVCSVGALELGCRR
jgi:hypothetical protein